MRSLIILTARIVAALALAGAGMTACKSSDTANPVATDGGDGGAEYIDFCALPKSCQDIVQACHIKDDGTVQAISDCHETAHDVGTDSACQKVRSDCVAKCNAAPALPNSHPETFGPCGDGGADAGHHGHTDAGH
jgi:hypothetical protein